MHRSSAFATVVGVVLTLCLCGVPIGFGVRAYFDVEDKKDQRQRALDDYYTAPVPEVVVGSPSAPATRLTLPTFAAGELADGASWPRACSMLTDDDITAILPEADLFERTGESNTRNFVLNEQSASGLTSVKRSWSINIPEYRCTIRFWLPHKSRTGEKERIADLTVAVDVAGDPATVLGFSGPYAGRPPESDFARQHGAAGCYGLTIQSFVRCTRGPLTIDVAGTLLTDQGKAERIRMPATAPAGGVSPYYAIVVTAAMTRLLAKIPS